MDAAPFQPDGDALAGDESVAPGLVSPVVVDATLLDELWRESEAGAWGLARGEFVKILVAEGTKQNFGLAKGAGASPQQQAAFFRGLRIEDLVLARACGAGNERAWEHFVATFHESLVRSATAISRSDTVGRDLADALYAELYGLTVREGERRCPLDSYRGRGSLLGWLRTTLAQRHVDHYRRSHREKPLEEFEEFDRVAPDNSAESAQANLPVLASAVADALRLQNAEERFLMAAYYLDEKTLAQIAEVVGVHEATVSRRLRRVTDVVRKQVLQNLTNAGMSRRAAEEALGTDPRDIDLAMDLKKLLQSCEAETFQEQAGLSETSSKATFPGKTISEKAKATG
ncbi:MAG: sigma-70 family RNA polymerase sigma factor [Acidobacteriaceae bacterium]